MQPRTRAGVNIRPSDNPSGVNIKHGPSDTHHRAGHRAQLLQIPANHTYILTLLLEHIWVLALGWLEYKPVPCCSDQSTCHSLSTHFKYLPQAPTSLRILRLCPFDGKTSDLSYWKKVGRVSSNKWVLSRLLFVRIYSFFFSNLHRNCRTPRLLSLRVILKTLASKLPRKGEGRNATFSVKNNPRPNQPCILRCMNVPRA